MEEQQAPILDHVAANGSVETPFCAGGARASADQVRAIFDLYLQERSLLRCVELLNGRGWRTKSWTTRKGTLHDGSRWDKTGLRGLLRNPTYVGKVSYRGQVYEGEHGGIIEVDVFARVGEMLAGGRKDPTRAGNKHGFLLRGLVRCMACGSAMTSATSSPRGKPYRYYTCTAVRRRGTGECPVRAVAAVELEAFIVDRIREIGRDPALLQETLRVAAQDREGERTQLEQERRMLQAEHQTCRGEARRLAGQPALTDRMAALDERAAQIETRLGEIQRALAAIEGTEIDPQEASRAQPPEPIKLDGAQARNWPPLPTRPPPPHPPRPGRSDAPSSASTRATKILKSAIAKMVQASSHSARGRTSLRGATT